MKTVFSRLKLQPAFRCCAGMFYLHHQCNPPLLHLDLKSANVLFAADGRARIADFGNARALGDARGGFHAVSGWRAMFLRLCWYCRTMRYL